MSEPKQVYQIMPVGEIYYPEDEEQESEQMTDERELFLNQLDGWIRDLNLAANVIKPFIVQRRKTILGKNGKEKVVVPCMTDLYKVFTKMQEASFQLRKDTYR